MHASPPTTHVHTLTEDHLPPSGQENDHLGTPPPVTHRRRLVLSLFSLLLSPLNRYYDANGEKPSEWEMYDLVTDPYEVVNLAWQGYQRNPEQQAEYIRLKSKLAWVNANRLAPLNGRQVLIDLSGETVMASLTQDQVRVGVVVASGAF